MTDWLLVPQNGALLNLIGFIVGTVGLFLTTFGILIALKQLSSLKTQSETIEVTVRSMQCKVSSLDVAKECQAAAAKIADIRTTLKVPDWEKILAGYEFLIGSFLRLAHASEVVSSSDKDAMIKMTEDMAKICDRVRSNIHDPAQARRLRGQDQALRNFADVITKISFTVEKGLKL